MIRPSRGWLSLVVLIVWTVGGAPPARADDTDAACQRVAGRLFRVQSLDPNSAKKTGAAYLLRVDATQNPPVAEFATCYHVVQRCAKVRIYTVDNPQNPLASFEKPESGSVKVFPDLDLALFRAPMPGRDTLALPPLADEGKSANAFVFGFPFQSLKPFPVEVRVAEGRKEAQYLGFLRQAGPMAVRFLGKELTYPGMSGGPVVTTDGKYAGMLLGRMPEPSAVPVLLVAEQVVASMNEGKWVAFDAKAFTDDLAYRTESKFRDQLTAPFLVADKDWSSYETWTRALGGTPGPFLRDFLEVPADLAILRGLEGVVEKGPLPSLSVSEGVGSVPDGEPKARHEVRFRWNGHDWDPKNPLPLRPGENLLVVTKVFHSGANGVVLNDLLRPNPVQIDLALGGTKVFQVTRTLPAFIRNYTIFVTVHNGSAADEAARDPYTARLAVRLDYLADLINRVPFRLPISGTDPRTGSEYAGAAVSTGRYFTLGYVSPQTLDATLSSTIEVHRVAASFAGVRLAYPSAAVARQLEAEATGLAAVAGGLAGTTRPRPVRTYPLTMQGRLQFPSEQAAAAHDDTFFYAAPRAHGANSDEPLHLPIFGNDIEIDVGPVLREALVCYVNKELLIPEKAAVPGQEQVRQVLVQAGMMTQVPGYRLRPVRAFLKKEHPGVRDDEPSKIWLVITFRTVRDDTGTGVFPDFFARLFSPPLLPARTTDGREVGLDLAANWLPLRAAAVHLVPGPAANPLAREVTTADRARVIWAHSIHLCLDTAGGAAGPREPVVLDPKAEKLGPAVGSLLQAVFHDAPKSLDAVFAGDAPLRLFAALPAARPLLAVPPATSGAFRVTAELRAGKTELRLRTVTPWAAVWDAETRPADQVSATKLAFKISECDLTADLAGRGFRGRIVGQVSAAALTVGKEGFQDPHIAFELDVDSTRPNDGQVQLKVTAKAAMWGGVGKLPEKTFTICGGAGSSFDQLRTEFLHQFTRSFLFKPAH